MLPALDHALRDASVDLCSPAFADALEAAARGAAAGSASGAGLRAGFHFPRTPTGARYRTPGSPCAYLCGHSLGLAPVRAEERIRAEVRAWAAGGVAGHFRVSGGDSSPGEPQGAADAEHAHAQRPQGQQGGHNLAPSGTAAASAAAPGAATGASTTDAWGASGAGGWARAEDSVVPGMAALVGASPDEVAVTGTLTGNLHACASRSRRTRWLSHASAQSMPPPIASAPIWHPHACLPYTPLSLAPARPLATLSPPARPPTPGLAPFYRPSGVRTRILIEARAFPSDAFAASSAAALHGLPSEASVLRLSPRPVEDCLREADILAAIAAAGDTLALVLWPAVQYYTGQAFPLRALAAAAHAAGALLGVDAAHGVGNVALDLHAAGVDFAVWCSYKYVNAGPGGIGGLFVHDRWAAELGGAARPHMAGWWGARRDGRFAMGDAWQPTAAPAARLQLSNPSALLVASLRASLETIGLAGGAPEHEAAQPHAVAAALPALRDRAAALTLYLEALLVTELGADLGCAGDADGLGRPHPALAERLRAVAAAAEAPPRAAGSGSLTRADAAAGGARAALLEETLRGGGAAAAAAAAVVAAAGDGSGDNDGDSDAPLPSHPPATAVRPPPAIRILTPAAPGARGCQLSLAFAQPARAVHARLEREGVVVDLREPHVLRVAPVPLYNTAADVLDFVTTLKLVLAEGEGEEAAGGRGPQPPAE